jgi:hypothetical protein
MSTLPTLRWTPDRYPTVEVHGVFDKRTEREIREQLREAGRQGLIVHAVHMDRAGYDHLRREMRKRFFLFQEPLLTLYFTSLSGVTGLDPGEIRLYAERPQRQALEDAIDKTMKGEA